MIGITIISIAGKIFFTALVTLIVMLIIENFYEFNKEKSPDWLPMVGGGSVLIGFIALVVLVVTFIWC